MNYSAEWGDSGSVPAIGGPHCCRNVIYDSWFRYQRAKAYTRSPDVMMCSVIRLVRENNCTVSQKRPPFYFSDISVKN